jgi:class 3 adenylate cyclase
MAVCANCGAENPLGFRFCGTCGTKLEAGSTAGPLSLFGQERKVVSVLFCDLVGFTARSDHADPEDVGAMLRPYHARLRVEIERLGGTVDKLIGDAIMAVFGVPVSHEDDPERTVRCALRMLEAVAELNRDDPRLSLHVRIGVNTGEALVDMRAGRESETVVGDVVNTASRLQGAAPVDAAVVGEPTWRATRRLFDFEALEPVRLKGKAEPVPLWRVVAARGRTAVHEAAGPPTPFVGRRAELARLDRAVTALLRGGRPWLVNIVGSPGVGKSRLVRELSVLVDKRHELIAWRQGRCLAYGDGISFWALAEIVKAEAGVLDTDGQDEAADRLDSTLDGLVTDPAEREWIRAALASLLGLTETEAEAERAHLDRRESFAAWRRFLEAVAAGRPLIIVVEDLHWADPALLDFLDHLIDQAAQVPLLVVTTTRPELAGRHPEWTDPAAARPGREVLLLTGLSDGETASLAHSLLGSPVLPAGLQAVLLERVGGNPLYAEEFLRLLTDRGLLVPDGRTVRLTCDPADLPYPDTIHALIAARLDTLGASDKLLLQDAAVLGREFRRDGLAVVSGLNAATLERRLARLVRHELVRPVAGAPGQARYVFPHALTKDVVYGQIPRAARVRRHRAAAEWLTGLGGERGTELAELAAHHWAQALELSRAGGTPDDGLTDATRAALVLAGDRTIDLDAPRSARYQRQALDLAPPGHPARAALLAKAGTAEQASTGRSDEAASLYEQAAAAFEAAGDRRAQGAALERLAVARWNVGDARGSQAALAEAIQLLEGEPDSAELASAYAQMASGAAMEGRPEEALDWAGRALALADRLDLPLVRLRVLDARGTARCVSGDLGGLADLRAALAIGLEAGAGYDTAIVYTSLCDPVLLAEGPRAALDICREGLAFAERRGLELAAWFQVNQLAPQFDLGRWDELLTTAERVVEWEREAGAFYLTALARIATARVLACQGRTADARELAGLVLPVARDLDDLQALVPVLVGQAVIAQLDDDLDAAADALDELDRLVAGRSAGPWHRAAYAAELAGVALALERPALLRDLVAQAGPAVARHQAGARSAAAALAELEGREAGDAWLDAAAAWEAYGHLPHRAAALLGAARCLPPARADGALTEGRAILKELGAAL